MSVSVPKQFDNVSVTCKANVYFDGKVISHSVIMPGGDKKSVGVILPGTYRFDTKEREVMSIVAGSCHVLMDGSKQKLLFTAGEEFEVPPNSYFEITAVEPTHYVCSFG